MKQTLPPINLFDALDAMNAVDADGKAIPFSITFITANLTKRGRMGRVVKLENVILAKHNTGLPIAVRTDYTPTAAKTIKEQRLRNSIKRVWSAETQEITNVNIRLLIQFNGREVIWYE